MTELTDWTLLAARACLSLVFLYSGLDKMLNRHNAMAEVSALRLPYPGMALLLTIIVQLGAGLMVLLGFQARLGAVVLMGFTVVATLLGHPFWNMHGSKFRHAFTISLEHVAIVGGFLLIAALGPGALSLDGILLAP